MRYALINPSDEIVRTQEESRLDLSAGVRAGYRWVPVNDITNDTSTGDDIVKEPVVQTIFADRVERVTTIRDMTAQELDDLDTANADRQFEMLHAFARVVLDQVNALNARMNDANVAAGLGNVNAFTVQQMKNAIKARLR